MAVDVKYETSAKATGGRDGTAETLNGSLKLNLTTPKELGGAGGEGNNPEELFAIGYAACFIGALKLVGGQHKVSIPADTSITSTVGIGPRSEGGFGLAVALEVSIPGVDKTVAEDLVAKAHEVCPYSNATRNNIDVKLSVA
ncbi:organic hydroperoxide resistance protein [Stappia sp. BW2]|jgi:Ohr subfamily peroxiredoxin|uniref:organic hydroperoxide resistance protein n=1 Tax=Stappia sp. BW2 TaxID=2592622 RepID=UPI0011DEA958|nr:organic hydroperoxide resistance protein [Stappia sp. BW2]TYC65492.1 organic hydroperoxide resistance protein [Stappia sp. BW2]